MFPYTHIASPDGGALIGIENYVPITPRLTRFELSLHITKSLGSASPIPILKRWLDKALVVFKEDFDAVISVQNNANVSQMTQNLGSYESMNVAVHNWFEAMSTIDELNVLSDGYLSDNTIEAELFAFGQTNSNIIQISYDDMESAAKRIMELKGPTICLSGPSSFSYERAVLFRCLIKISSLKMGFLACLVKAIDLANGHGCRLVPTSM